MKIIILAAGKGTRLGKLNNNKPKCLLKIDGSSLIERNIYFFKKANLEPIIVTGFKKEKLNFLNVPTVYNHEFETSNMLWSLYAAKEHMHEDFLVCYSDILVNINQIIQLKNFKNGIGLLIDRDWLEYWKLRFSNPLEDAESLKLSQDGQIIDIGQKEKSLSNIQGQYIGFFKISGKKRLSFIKQLKDYCENNNTRDTAKKAYLTDFFQLLIKNKFKIKAVFTNGGWVEIDNPFDIMAAHKSGRLKIIEQGF
ncbi:MAG: hypothetical protein CMJ06_03975 [Pelagibacterales bacterium]|nr:hypothetical protein [Pelagibacterales bacterium]OUU62169.1 MAG: hypothetical protein CBC22_05425 [Alphaproteobacteria bacterium TMED62]|tara:strand:- start:5813 stop:6568 length:756 start_codon:yes stop_codon:yes gene_type:complete